MTKQLLILAYILAVLALSSMVRAEVLFPPMTKNFAGNGIVRQAAVDQVTGIMTLRGFLSTPCDARPTIVVNNLDRKNGHVEFAVATLKTAAFCTENLGQSFDISFDLKEISLEVDRTYVLEFTNSSAIQLIYKAVKPLDGFDSYKVARQNFKGTLVYLPEGTGYPQPGFALRNGSEIVRVFSPDLDLARFNKSSVTMSGYVVNTASLNGEHDNLALSSPEHTVIVPVSVTRVEQQ